MPKRPQAGSAAAGSDADAKKAKPHVHVSSHKIMIPPNTEPESPKLTGPHASLRAGRRADENATSEIYCTSIEHYPGFAKLFEAAVASACAKWHRPATLSEVITAIAETGCKVRIGKHKKNEFVWKGFKECRWQISRICANNLLVAFPKDAAMTSQSKSWRFSPSPAARRPLAKLSCESPTRSSAGCVVC